MNITVVVLLSIGLYLIIMFIIEDYKRQETQSKVKPTEAPQKQNISLLDYQFDDANFPSTTYSQMFYSSTPWLHGRGLGDGKIFIVRDANIPKPMPELSQNELNQIASTPAPTLRVTAPVTTTSAPATTVTTPVIIQSTR